jgi:hypothetical protein
MRLTSLISRQIAIDARNSGVSPWVTYSKVITGLSLGVDQFLVYAITCSRKERLVSDKGISIEISLSGVEFRIGKLHEFEELLQLMRQLVQLQTELSEQQDGTELLLTELLGQVRKVNRKLGPRTPKPVSLFIQSEKEGNMLQYEIQLPALPAGHDVVSRKLTVATDGGAPVESVIAPDTSSVPGEGAQGATLVVTLQDTDDAGNVSAESSATFTLVDTIPPAAPGAIGLVVTGETPDVPAPPSP